MIFEKPIMYIVMILVILIVVVVAGLYSSGSFDILRHALGMIGA
jgi:hypothetical protein